MPAAMTKTCNGDALVSVHELRTHFPASGGKLLKAVDGVTFGIGRGTTLGLVGESGCGKTTLGQNLLRLVRATSGSVVFDGLDVLGLGSESMRRLRRRMQIVFQDVAGSLNPRMTVGELVGEGLVIHRAVRGRRLRECVVALLERVGLSVSLARRYPHELSGGQQQRVGIARAIAVEPDFLVCDEPVSALDVSVQAQILNLLDDLRRERSLTCLFIGHNPVVVAHFSNVVAVMYLGRIVEIAPAETVYSQAGHPYTRALWAAVPEPDPTRPMPRSGLGGEVPSPIDPPGGCPFHPRCPLVVEECRRVRPVLEPVAGGRAGHVVACHRADAGLTERRDAENAEKKGTLGKARG